MILIPSEREREREETLIRCDVYYMHIVLSRAFAVVFSLQLLSCRRIFLLLFFFFFFLFKTLLIDHGCLDR